jgi:hypothetical protein
MKTTECIDVTKDNNYYGVVIKKIIIRTFKQILYLGHWIVKLDVATFMPLLNYAQKISSRSKISLLMDILYCVFSYNISIHEYFQFNFFLADKEERKKYVGNRLMQEYLLKMNPISDKFIVHNKLKFLEIYAPFIKHGHATLADLRADNESVAKVLNNKSGKIVLKSAFGSCGSGIEVISVNNLDSQAIIERLAATGNDFIEECVVQHKDLMKLSPSGLNTLRIMTLLNYNDEVEILGAILRISINKAVDNWHAGNIAAPINLSTGIVEGPAFYMDITKPDEYYHPITGAEIIGFKIPYWKESLQMIKEVALHNRKCRSIGWDIAITDDGLDLIEGNHDWDKVIWQRSAKRGLKPLVKPYL